MGSLLEADAQRLNQMKIQTNIFYCHCVSHYFCVLPQKSVYAVIGTLFLVHACCQSAIYNGAHLQTSKSKKRGGITKPISLFVGTLPTMAEKVSLC